MTRVRLSTHFFRRNARKSQRHYRRVQAKALMRSPHRQAEARTAMATLAAVGVSSRAGIKVERARSQEHGRWIVVGVEG